VAVMLTATSRAFCKTNKGVGCELKVIPAVDGAGCVQESRC
jgi:hypothetical protein